MPARPTSFADQQSPPYKDTQYASTYNSQDRLGSSYRPMTATQSESQHYNALPIQRPQEGSNTATAHNTPPSSMAQAPDPLTRAFNEAVRPYLDKIDRLEAEIEEKNLDIQQLEEERADMHAWIDKRGLRAGKPPPRSAPIRILLALILTMHLCTQTSLHPSPQR